MDNADIMQLRQHYIFPNQISYYQTPLQLVRAKGAKVWDEKGKEYLDAIGGIVTISVGHNHPKIQNRLKQFIADDVIQHTTYLYLSRYVAQLAEKLAQFAPGKLSRCYFTNSGSEANEMAVLAAREATGRQMMLSLRYGYHGGTGVPLALCGHSTWKFTHSPQVSVGHVSAPYCYRCPFKKTPDNCELECADDVQNVIETATSGEIAGLIAEPIMGVGGFIDPPPAYFQKVYQIVKAYDGLYISDEVQTGMGRTGEHFFAIETMGIVPDLITMAKGLGSGVPIGVVITQDEIANALLGTTHFNTFGGDPYQAMQASEVIDIIVNEELIENARVQGEFLKSELRNMMRSFDVIGDVRGRGLMLGIELVGDRKTKVPAPDETMRIMEAAKHAGLLVGKGGYYNNILRLAPSMGITNQESEQLIERLKRAFKQTC